MKISPDLLDAVLDHATREYPYEACGILAGRREPERVFPMRNAARSRFRYRFDPAQQLAVWQELDDLDLEPLVIYHSHPFGQPVPSQTDIDSAPPEPTLHLVIGMAQGVHDGWLWRIENGTATAEPLS